MRAATALVLLGLALGSHATSAAAAPHGLQLGVADASFISSDAALREEWMAKAETTRANLALLGVTWSNIAPRVRPSGFDPSDPADPAYDWKTLDAAVRGAVAQGLQPVLQIDYAPAWAEGPNRPSPERAPPGTWLPQPQQLGLFSQALAARYSGRFVDPAHPGAGPLPHVRYFEVWGEENLFVHLNPLWEGNRLVGPQHYREMLNAAYPAIHHADPGSSVIFGGLAPYGDAEVGGLRVPPVWFWRALLCLPVPKGRSGGCPEPVHFDIAAHDPIDDFGPSQGAVSPGDVSTPDIGQLTAILHKAVSTGRVLPAGPKPFWATEIWWDSDPPDPHGVPIHLHARYLTEALYILWRQGVSAVIWWYMRDQAPGTAGYAATQQSGLFYLDGTPKPAFQAFRFPFIAEPGGRGRVLVWGKAPSPGRLLVERRTPRGWAPLARPVAGPSRVFLARAAAGGPLLLRAVQDGQQSLPWRAR